LLKEKGVCFKDCSKSANLYINICSAAALPKSVSTVATTNDVAGSSDIAQINKETDGKIEFPASKVAVADDLD